MDSSCPVSELKMELATVAVTVVEQEVVDLWRTVGSSRGLCQDTDVAMFLLRFYLDHKPAKQSTNSHCHTCAGKLSSTIGVQTRFSLINRHLCNACEAASTLRDQEFSESETRQSADANRNSPEDCVLIPSEKNFGDKLSERKTSKTLSTGSRRFATGLRSSNLKSVKVEEQTSSETAEIQRSENKIPETAEKYWICDGTPFADGPPPKSSYFDVYQCSKCQAKFPLRQLANRHMKSPDCENSFNRPADKFPVCDGEEFRDGIVPQDVKFSEMKCSICSKVFSKRHFLHRHVYNETCVTSEQYFVKLFTKTSSAKKKKLSRRRVANEVSDNATSAKRKSTRRKVASEETENETSAKKRPSRRKVESEVYENESDSDENEDTDVDYETKATSQRQDPKTEYETGKNQDLRSDEKSEIFRADEEDDDNNSGGEDDSNLDVHFTKQKRYREETLKPYTIKDFWTGKFRYEWGGKVSHYYCEWCAAIFPQGSKRQFKEHEQACEKKIPGVETNPNPPPPISGEGMEILRQVKEKYLRCCDQCERVFYAKERHRMHVRSHCYARNGNGRYKCLFCKRTFKTFSQINIHVSLPKTQSMECEYCKFQYRSHCQVKPHYKTHGKRYLKTKQEKGEQNVIKCEFCGLGLVGLSKREVKRHVRNHTDKCEVCGTMLTGLGKKAVKLHMQSHDSNPPVTAETPKRTLCPICGKEFEKGYMRKHIKWHRGTRETFSCHVCAKVFMTKHSRDDHERLHGDKNEICEHCGKKFYTRVTLQHHVKSKHSGQIFRCEECGKQMSSEAHVRDHVRRVHKKLRPFACHFCPRVFPAKVERDEHTRTHTNEKPFSCPQCSYTCGRRDYLKKHMVTHAAYKPFRCEDCSASFNEATRLKQHRLQQHKESVYPCPDCPEKFPLQSTLAYHRYNQHGGVYPTNRTLHDAVLSETSSSFDNHIGVFPTNITPVLSSETSNSVDYLPNKTSLSDNIQDLRTVPSAKDQQTPGFMPYAESSSSVDYLPNKTSLNVQDLPTVLGSKGHPDLQTVPSAKDQQTTSSFVPNYWLPETNLASFAPSNVSPPVTRVVSDSTFPTAMALEHLPHTHH